MIEKIRIELWDIFVYFVTGILILINLYFIDSKLILNSTKILFGIQFPSFILTVVLITIPVILGFLFEPFANIYEKVFRKCKWFNSIRDWQDSINKQQDVIKSRIADLEVDDNIYHYCKNYISQKGIYTPSMAFLSKFGFYRNIAFLFFVNSIYLIRYFCTISWLFSIAILLSFLLSQFYLKRSFDFYCHLTQTVYQNFLVATK